MNILYTITSYLPSMGGAQLYLHEITKRALGTNIVNVVSFFDENRNDWLLGTTLNTPEKERCYDYERVGVRRLGFTKKEKLRMFPFVAAYYFNKNYNIRHLADFIEGKLNPEGVKIDLIHNVRVGREPLSYASYNLAKKLNVPFFLTPLHHPRWSHWFYREYHRLYRQADGLFALTTHEKEIYKRLGVKEENIFVTGTGPVLSNSVDPEAFRKKYDLVGKIVLFIGQGYRYKGIDTLLKAAKDVFRKAKDINFVFIGPHTSYSQKLFRKEADSRIRHLGKVDLQTKSSALAACDIFCLPSAQESFGAVFLEAWSFGKPVIGRDIPQLRSFIRDGEDGFLVSGSYKEIAGKILTLLENPELSRRLGESGRAKAQEEYSWDNLYKKTISSYEEVLRRF